jgi:hypothetical protein
MKEDARMISQFDLEELLRKVGFPLERLTNVQITFEERCQDGRGTIEFTVPYRSEYLSENGRLRALRDSFDICLWWTEGGIRRRKEMRYEEALRYLGWSLWPKG